MIRRNEERLDLYCEETSCWLLVAHYNFLHSFLQHRALLIRLFRHRLQLLEGFSRTITRLKLQLRLVSILYQYLERQRRLGCLEVVERGTLRLRLQVERQVAVKLQAGRIGWRVALILPRHEANEGLLYANQFFSLKGGIYNSPPNKKSVRRRASEASSAITHIRCVYL